MPMSKGEHDLRMEEALASSDPADSLYELAKWFRDAGMPRIELCLLFESYFVELQRNEQTPENDLRLDSLSDVLDCIVGYPYYKNGYFYPDRINAEALRAARNEKGIK